MKKTLIILVCLPLLFISCSNKTKKKGLKNKIESKSDLKLANINGNVKKYSIITYNPDSSTNLIQSFWYNKDGNTTQNKNIKFGTFGTKNKIVRETTFKTIYKESVKFKREHYLNDSLINELFYKYDKSGNIINNDTLRNTKRNEDGYIIELEQNYNEYYKISYKYFKENGLVKEKKSNGIYVNNNDTMFFSQLSTYDNFDKYNNWTRRKFINLEDSSILTFSEIKIEYYD